MIKIAPEIDKDRQEILNADSAQDILDEDYTESDLRRDWYLNDHWSELQDDIFRKKGLTGVKMELDGKSYEIIGVPHGIKGIFTPDENLKGRVNSYIQAQQGNDSKILHEQNLEQVFELGSSKAMDDQSWMIEKLEEKNAGYVEHKINRKLKLESNQYWLKVGAEFLGYNLLNRLGREEFVSKSEMLREGEIFAKSLNSMQSGKLEDFQRTVYRTQLPEPLSRELSEDVIREYVTSGRSERMAEYALNQSSEFISMVVGAAHMFQIPHYLEKNEPQDDLYEPDLEFSDWQENELEPRLEREL